MTRDDIVQLFDRRLQALNDHDVEEFADTYSETAVVESPLGGTHQGRGAIAGVAASFLTALSDATFTSDELVIDGDRVVQVMTLSGTDTGGFMGMAPSGRPAQLPMVVVCHVRDGLVMHERRIYDFTGMLVQIGVLKAKPA
jgi:predicted ester cyclase